MAPIPRLVLLDTVDKYHTPSRGHTQILAQALRLLDCEQLDSDNENESSGFCFDSCDRKVEFKMTVKKRGTICLKDFTEEERNSCWYTREEKEKMKTKFDKMVARFEAGKPAKKRMTYRGLESWVGKGGAALDANIARCVDAVMDEQDRQWVPGISTDCDAIAAKSQAVTQECVQNALKLAKADEIDAKMTWGIIDDSNCVTDDESVGGVASLVAKKRANRKRRKSGKEVKQDSKKTSNDAKPGRAPITAARKTLRKDPPGKVESDDWLYMSKVNRAMRSTSLIKCE